MQNEATLLSRCVSHAVFASPLLGRLWANNTLTWRYPQNRKYKLTSTPSERVRGTAISNMHRTFSKVCLDLRNFFETCSQTGGNISQSHPYRGWSNWMLREWGQSLKRDRCCVHAVGESIWHDSSIVNYYQCSPRRRPKLICLASLAATGGWISTQHGVLYDWSASKRLETCIYAERGHSERLLWHCLPDIPVGTHHNRFFSEPPTTTHNWLSSEPPTFERTQQTFSQMKKYCNSQVKNTDSETKRETVYFLKKKKSECSYHNAGGTVISVDYQLYATWSFDVKWLMTICFVISSGNSFRSKMN